MAAAGRSIPALVRDLSSRKRTAQAAAALALCRLADGASGQTLDAIAAAGAVPALVQLMLRGQPGGPEKMRAAEALMGLVEDEGEQRCAAVAAAGGIPALLALLEPGSSGEHTASALAWLAHNSPQRAAAVVAASGVPRLLCMLQSAGSSREADSA